MTFLLRPQKKQTKKECITTGGVETPKLWVYGLVAIDKCVQMSKDNSREYKIVDSSDFQRISLWMCKFCDGFDY